MRKLEEFVNEKLRVSKDNVTLDNTLGEQGWKCTSVFSMYTEIREVDHFLKTDMDLERLQNIDTEDYTEGKVEFVDKVFRAFKRWKWCNKIINVILSGYTFNEGFDKIQEILNHPTKCEYSGSSVEDKRQVIRIIDSHKKTAMVLSFNKL